MIFKQKKCLIFQSKFNKILFRLISFMGGSESVFRKNKWQFKYRMNEFYDVYQNAQGLLSQKHVVPYNSKISQQDQMAIYQYRYKTDKPIVHVYNADFMQSQGFCMNQSQIQVYSEYIPYRLSDIKQLEYGQMLYVLSESLRGFQQLHNKVGSFTVTDNHVGFNTNGQTRVWLNQNFGKNHLEQDRIILTSTKNPKDFDIRMKEKQQQDMVQDLWEAIFEHAQSGIYLQRFRESVKDLKDSNFQQARQIVNIAINDEGVYVPKSLEFQSRIHNFDVGSQINNNNFGFSQAQAEAYRNN